MQQVPHRLGHEGSGNDTAPVDEHGGRSRLDAVWIRGHQPVVPNLVEQHRELETLLVGERPDAVQESPAVHVHPDDAERRAPAGGEVRNPRGQLAAQGAEDAEEDDQGRFPAAVPDGHGAAVQVLKRKRGGFLARPDESAQRLRRGLIGVSGRTGADERESEEDGREA